MFRRSSAVLKSEFNFGHPQLTQHFGKITGRGLTAPVDAGVKTTTLPNGVRVITHDMGAPVASIGFYCEAGPKFDPRATPGLSHMMRYGLFGSNMNQSVFQSDRELRAYGAPPRRFAPRTLQYLTK